MQPGEIASSTPHLSPGDSADSSPTVAHRRKTLATISLVTSRTQDCQQNCHWPSFESFRYSTAGPRDELTHCKNPPSPDMAAQPQQQNEKGDAPVAASMKKGPSALRSIIAGSTAGAVEIGELRLSSSFTIWQVRTAYTNALF